MRLVRVVGGALLVITIFVAWLPSKVSAIPLGQVTWAKTTKLALPNLWRAHGFHCRKEAGWDPTTGHYRYHQHAGICNDYARCLSVNKQCIVLFHKGWTEWKYERWGFETNKYTYCMARRGCI